jgi:two-component system, chemotaxis family, CheB/CheR fusion protein
MNDPETIPEFESLLKYIKRVRGFDFMGYKRSSLKRRIDRRMQMLQIEDYDQYNDYLEVHPEEFTHLFDTMLINVTDFFRDKPIWDFMASDIIPEMIANAGEDAEFRVWSAGCATGQEAYTVAMLFAEQLGIEAFVRRVKIYATDLDNDALQTARQGTYSAKQIADVPLELANKYFETNNGAYTIIKELRRCVIFGRNDLIQDAPISRVDLLICRNTLMYFNAETQSKIITRFHFALKNTGFLMLGKAEMMFSYTSLFLPYDLKRRIFRKVPRTRVRDRRVLPTMMNNDDDNVQLSHYIQFREIAFNSSPVAQIVVDLNGFLAMSNERARALLKISSDDNSRPIQDFDFVYRVPELKNRIAEVYTERRIVTFKDIQWLTVSGDTRNLEIQISPLIDANNRILGVSVAFLDMTAYNKLQKELESANQELETAYEELQSTNEELETTNEELQSTIEELETTNEELQSTNEELETTNEELQSTNEELHAMNEEANRYSQELDRVNYFLSSILASVPGAVVVLNQEYQVQIWGKKAHDLWGLQDSETIGKNFLNLDIGLRVELLATALRNVLTGEGEELQVTVDAVNRRGKHIKCVVNCIPLLQPAHESMNGIILIMEEVET